MRRRSRLAFAAVAAGTLVLALGAAVSIARPFFGTNGDDVINGTDQHDYIVGRAGNDVFHVRDGEADTVDCGDGNDVVLADFKDKVAANCEVVKRRVPRQHPKPGKDD